MAIYSNDENVKLCSIKNSVIRADKLQEWLFTGLTKDIQVEYLFHGA